MNLRVHKTFSGTKVQLFCNICKFICLFAPKAVLLRKITIACGPLIFNNEVIAIPAIIYALMMNLILIAYVFLTKLGGQ